MKLELTQKDMSRMKKIDERNEDLVEQSVIYLDFKVDLVRFTTKRQTVKVFKYSEQKNDKFVYKKKKTLFSFK